LVNSFCHRDYRISQNNEVSIYKSRIEIYNPGKFPEGLTPEDFIEGSERSIKRNPVLAGLLYFSKDVESFGTGLKRIKHACDKAKVKVEFKMLKSGFMVVFYRSDNVKADKKPIETDKKPIETSNANVILDYLNDHDFINNQIARELLGLADSTTKRLLKNMVDENLLIAIGERRNRIYKLKENQ